MQTVQRFAFAFIALGVAAPAYAGYYFESSTTTEGGPRGRSTAATVHGWIDGGNAKIEFQDDSGTFGEGTYIVTTAGSSVTYFVDPKKQTVAEIDLEQMLGMFTAALDAAGGAVQLDFSDFVNENLGESAGEPILGYETTRYRFRTGYTMSMRVLGMGRSSTISNDNEFWCTDEIDSDGFSAWLRPDRFRTGNAEIDNMIRQQYAGVDCLPLRSRVVSTTTGQRGNAQTSTATTEVLVLKEENVPASTFEIPAGYERQSLADAMPPGAPPADASAETPDDGERRRPRLRDLLNR